MTHTVLNKHKVWSKIHVRFLSKHFSYSCFSTKMKFLHCLLSSVVLWHGPMMDPDENTFGI